MACEAWLDSLDAYLDGELAAERLGEFSAHLRGCLGCAGEVLERVRLKRAVQRAGQRYTPSAQLREKIGRAVAAKSRGKIFLGWKFALASGLFLLAALAVTVNVGRERADTRHIYSELADLHVATLASATPVDVVSTDRHTVKPWFQGRIPFTFNLPEVGATEFGLMGGKVFYLQQTPGAHLIYRLRQHEISVFILPEREGAAQAVKTGAVNALSFNTDSWTQNGLRYFMVGDVNAEDLRRLETMLRDAR
jgi:anti-sigma factor RsiW